MNGVLLGANKKLCSHWILIKNTKSIFKTKQKELALIKRQFLKKRYFLRGEMAQNNPPILLKKS
ncbi:hypothetical protein DD775_07875 [Helicobacter pylori]|nr:hypothetical protein DD775_07875 [Helicobacter pylori]